MSKRGTPDRDVEEQMALTRATIGANIARYREQIGMGQADIAAPFNYGVQWASKVELGRIRLSAEMLAVICDVLGVNPDALYGKVEAVQVVSTADERLIIEALRTGEPRLRNTLVNAAEIGLDLYFEQSSEAIRALEATRAALAGDPEAVAEIDRAIRELRARRRGPGRRRRGGRSAT